MQFHRGLEKHQPCTVSLGKNRHIGLGGIGCVAITHGGLEVFLSMGCSCPKSPYILPGHGDKTVRLWQREDIEQGIEMEWATRVESKFVESVDLVEEDCNCKQHV